MGNFRTFIERNRNGTFQVRHRNPDGTKGTDYGAIEGEDKARALAKKVYKQWLRGEIKSDSVVKVDGLIQPLIQEFLDKREKNMNIAERTVVHNRISLEAFTAENPTITKISQITKSILVDWRDEMTGKGLAYDTIKGRLSDIRTWLGWLVERGDLKASPFSKGIMPKKNETEPKYYTDEEWQALDQDLAQRHPPTWIVCNLAHYAGLRKGEALAIEVRDLLFKPDGVYLDVRKEVSKGLYGAGVIPIPPELVKAIHHYVGSRKSGPIAGNVTRWQVDHYFQMARDATQIDAGLDIHGLRHTFAKNHLVKDGGTTFSLQKLMRHRSLASTAIYAKFEQSHIRALVDRGHQVRLRALEIAGQVAGQTTLLQGTAGQLQGNISQNNISEQIKSDDIRQENRPEKRIDSVRYSEEIVDLRR